MISIETVLLLVWAHFIADFIAQSDMMARSKSSSNKWLLIHVAIYTVIMCAFGWVFALVNGVLHFITDFITSRVASYFHKKDEIHWFFVVIGFDQAIHLSTLFITYHYIVE